MKNNKNEVQIYGVIMDIQPGTFFKDGEKFVRFYIGAKRTSGNVDLLPVAIPERMAENWKIGEHIYIEGKYTSYNKKENGKSHLILEVKAETLLGGDGSADDENKIILEGYLCKPPVYRRAPRGKEICDLMIACNEYDLRRTDYIPCIAWWKEAREAADFKVGDFVKIIGRIQSRIYHKKLSGDEVELRTAYEVSIGRIIEHESGSEKISLVNYKKFPSKSVDLFPRTEISGRNREGKSTLQDAYLDVLTGKMANGTEPTSIRRKENGVEVPKVDVVRELTLAIDGKEKVIRKITKQKWRKPRGQSEEVFDGNETSYEIDGFPAKSKDYIEFIQSIAEPSTLLMCSNPKPFLDTLQKSTAESRKVLEKCLVSTLLSLWKRIHSTLMWKKSQKGIP